MTAAQPPAATERVRAAGLGVTAAHVVCRSCGAVADVDCAAGGASCLTASGDHGFVIDEIEVSYWGLCPGCQGASC